MSSLDVSVILPSYHGAATAQRQVPVLLSCLDDLGVTYEVILVDDGSNDGGRSQTVARELGCRYLENAENLGKGAAVRRGMRAARGRYRVYTDIDIPYEPANLESMLWYLDFKEFHFVAGDRTLEGSSYYVQQPVFRTVASRAYSSVVGRLVAGGWYDTQCGLKGFRDHVADDLFGVARVNRFAFDVELFYIALKRNYDIKRLPVQLRCNEASMVNFVTDSATMVRDLGVIRVNELLGRYRPQVPVVRTIDSSRPGVGRRAYGDSHE